MNKSWLSLVLVVAFGAGCFGGQDAKNAAKATGQKPAEDCANADVPFACYLDKAMETGDASLCSQTGQEKWLNCLNAYEEITGIKTDCQKLTPDEFKADCEKARNTVTIN